jgi:hypothetical protein
MHIEIDVRARRDLRTGRNSYSIAVIGISSYEQLTHDQCFRTRGKLIDSYTNSAGVQSVHAAAIPEEIRQ